MGSCCWQHCCDWCVFFILFVFLLWIISCSKMFLQSSHILRCCWIVIFQSLILFDFSLSCSLALVFGWSNGWRNKLNALLFLLLPVEGWVGVGGLIFLYTPFPSLQSKTPSMYGYFSLLSLFLKNKKNLLNKEK